tara:strand:- start:1071 stop:2000 length:930 start_codon:yes stop_codon:yes gene_type:complete
MKNFINIKDISFKDLRNIISDARKRKIKRKKLSTLEVDKDLPLKGKLLVQMFEKSSLRTRISFYLAIRQLGGGALTLRPNELHIGKGNESLPDTAQVLSTYGDIFMLRTDSEKKIKEFAKYLKIPLVNGLSPQSHPAQILSDIFTIEEIKKKKISHLNICWIGDSNNVLNSLIEASVKFSFKLNIACPKNYKPNKKLLLWAKKNKGIIKIFHSSEEGIKGADVVLTDKVISMNDKVNKIKKLKLFKNFQVNKKLMNKAKKNAIFLHCLPRGPEVSNEVFMSSKSKVWQQALNRVHVQKSILLYCLGRLR